MPTRAKCLDALRFIRNAGQMTRHGLAEKMGVSLSLSNKVAAELLDAGLIRGAGRSESEGGRPADMLSLAPTAGYAIGVDINYASQTAVVTNLLGEVVADVVEPAVTRTDRQAIIANLKDLVDRSLQRAGVPARAVLGLGVCARAIVDATSGTILRPAHPGDTPAPSSIPGSPDTSWEAAWAESPFADSLREAFPYPHILVDDVVRALGLAEAYYGRGSRDRDFIYVLMDTGIGMAIMLQGIPYIGSSHIAGEIGHVPVSGEATPCECGNKGCLCTATNVAAVLTRLQRRLAESPVRSVLRGREGVTMDALVQAANGGDRLAGTIMSEAGELCGEALAIILNLFGPELIVLGGLSADSNDFIDSARRIARKKALERASRNVEIQRTALDRRGAARGAATLVLDALFAPGERCILDVGAGR